jgi:hypothetical protein
MQIAACRDESSKGSLELIAPKRLAVTWGVNAGRIAQLQIELERSPLIALEHLRLFNSIESGGMP